MNDPLPMPSISGGLGSDNTLDLEALDNAALKTFIQVGNFTDGDFIYPNWRGCGHLGQVIDDDNAPVPIDTQKIEPEGMPLTIANTLLKSLDQGWVFYSYSLGDQEGPKTEESARRFFYVGKRPALAALLPVAQLKGAHDLHLDPDEVPDDGVTAVIMPYENMKEDDVVVFKWQGYSSTGSARPVWSQTIDLTNEQVGKALEVVVPRAQVLLINKGKTEISYTIAYAETDRPITQSEVQTFQIDAPNTSLLPAIEIPGVTGYLDPQQYPNGLHLTIDNYPLIEAGDDIVFYALAPRGGSSEISVIDVDPSTVNRGLFNIQLDYAWLNNNTGLDITFTYQFSRLGTAGASAPLTVNISKARDVSEFPHLPDATPSGEGKGLISIKNAVGGVEVNIPESIELFPADTQHVRWNQVDEMGYYRGENETGTPRIFTVPMEAVAPNIGKSVQVFYEITPGEAMPPLVSPPYILTFSDLTSSDITPVVCTQPPSSGQLSKQAVEAAGGAEFTQKPWPYFLEGQLVKIIAKVGGVTHYLRGSESEGAAVTVEEVNKKALVAPLSVDVVKALKMNDELSVSSEISFDNGAVYKNNQPIVLTIIA